MIESVRSQPVQPSDFDEFEVILAIDDWATPDDLEDTIDSV